MSQYTTMTHIIFDTEKISTELHKKIKQKLKGQYPHKAVASNKEAQSAIEWMASVDEDRHHTQTTGTSENSWWMYL